MESSGSIYPLRGWSVDQFTCGEVTDFAEQKVEHVEIARCYVIGNIGQVPNS